MKVCHSHRATTSGLTTQVLLLKKLSFFLRGERWVRARCRFRRIRRNTEVRFSPGFWAFRRSDLWIGPLRMTMLTWLLSFSDRPRFALSSYTSGSGCQPRLASPHARPSSISECGARKRVRPISCEKTDTQCYLIDIDANGSQLPFVAPVYCCSYFCIVGVCFLDISMLWIEHCHPLQVVIRNRALGNLYCR